MFDICDCNYLILERAFLLESNTFSSFCDSLYSFVRFFFLFLFRYVKNGPHHSEKPSSSRESIEDDPFIAASTYSQNSVDIPAKQEEKIIFLSFTHCAKSCVKPASFSILWTRGDILTFVKLSLWNMECMKERNTNFLFCAYHREIVGDDNCSACYPR